MSSASRNVEAAYFFVLNTPTFTVWKSHDDRAGMRTHEKEAPTDRIDRGVPYYSCVPFVFFLLLHDLSQSVVGGKLASVEHLLTDLETLLSYLGPFIFTSEATSTHVWEVGSS